jgi:hypothetical protein
MCIWIYGKAGIGKSRYAFDAFDNLYVKDTSEFWDDYNGEDAVLMEDYDNDYKFLNMLKRIADCYPVKGKVKCRSPIPLKHETLIVTSNYALNDLFET